MLLFGFSLADQISKYFFSSPSFQTSNGLVDITYSTNTGSLWSLFSSVASINLFFIILSFIMLIALVVVFRKSFFSQKYLLSFSILTGGIVGNLLDRLFRGFVVDWINLHFWPVFNLADSFIVLGIILLSYYVVFVGEKDH